WPAVARQGRLEAASLAVGQTHVERAQARWQLDARADAAADPAVDLQASLTRLVWSQAMFKGTPPVESVQAQVKGTMRAHTLELKAETQAQPPAWIETFQPRPASAAASGVPPAASRSAGVVALRGESLRAPGGRGVAAPWIGWRGRVQQIDLHSTQ